MMAVPPSPESRVLIRLIVLAVLVLAGWPVPPAAAHPHAWIDVRVAVLFEAGRIVGLRQTWLFDEYYTAFATEGFDRDRDGRPDRDQLDALLAENLRNLADYDTFTRVTAAGQRVAVAAPVEASSRMVGSRLEMSFRLPLKDRKSTRLNSSHRT